ncbi:MAG: thiolase family protein [Myxococcales bacterium]|nr:thiolase family protein [Myxococcales bacterium]
MILAGVGTTRLARLSQWAALKACSTRSASTVCAARKWARVCTNTARSKQVAGRWHLRSGHAASESVRSVGEDMSMANTAEELGRRYQVTREQADQFAYRSQSLAKKARDAGQFDEEIEPVSVTVDAAEAPIQVRSDTHVLDDASMAKMDGRLSAAFEPGGIITAGNASAVVDGAAAMIIGRETDAASHGLRPLARLAGVAVAGCDPRIMGWGPVPATRLALARAGISGKDLDHVELNEAFAPQALAVMRDFEAMGIAPERVNPQGGAIALGHPLGASGAILTLTCAYALR